MPGGPGGPQEVLESTQKGLGGPKMRLGGLRECLKGPRDSWECLSIEGPPKSNGRIYKQTKIYSMFYNL